MPTTMIELPPIEVKTVHFTLVGDSPLIVHAWSEKAKRAMRDKQMKRATQAKAAKDPQADYEACFYRTDAGEYAFPAIGLKAAMVSACRQADMKMVLARGAFHIDADMLPIRGTPRMREDMVRVGMGVADLRYRPEFPDWRMPVMLKFNSRVISSEQLANLLDIAGFAVGVGEWRPEKSGQFGRFHVAGEGEA